MRMMGSVMRMWGFKMSHEACERISPSKTVGGHIALGAAHGRVSIGHDRVFAQRSFPFLACVLNWWMRPFESATSVVMMWARDYGS